MTKINDFMSLINALMHGGLIEVFKRTHGATEGGLLFKMFLSSQKCIRRGPLLKAFDGTDFNFAGQPEKCYNLLSRRRTFQASPVHPYMRPLSLYMLYYKPMLMSLIRGRSSVHANARTCQCLIRARRSVHACTHKHGIGQLLAP